MNQNVTHYHYLAFKHVSGTQDWVTPPPINEKVLLHTKFSTWTHLMEYQKLNVAKIPNVSKTSPNIADNAKTL